MSKCVKEQQPHASTNGAISQVERWPVVGVPVHIQKIDDLPKPQTINAIADGAANDQTDATQRADTLTRHSDEINHQGHDSHTSNGGEKPPQEGFVLTGQKAKSRARILHIREVKDIGDYRVRLMQREGRMHIELGSLIEQKNQTHQE